MSIEFLLTSLVVVMVPGTGVVYTLSCALTRGSSQSVLAALGCTLGIVPHMVACILGLAAILQTSPVAFSVIKYAGAGYLLYLAWGIWSDRGQLEFDNSLSGDYVRITTRGILINLLNPKLSIFFLAFLPQFVDARSASALPHMAMLSAVFMIMTFVVFAIYGIFAARLRESFFSSPKAMGYARIFFALAFVSFALKLLVTNPT